MKIKIDRLFVIFLPIIVFFIAISCRGVPKDVPDNLQPEEFFKNAQTAVVDWENYNAALFYYEEFIKRFPDMKGKIIEAEYEIAFIYYRKKNYTEAQQRFEAILDKYKSPESSYYNEWPRVLSEKIIENIKQKLPKNSES